MARRLKAVARDLQRATARVRRAEAARARQDTRVWVVQRRERTRRLIEFGSLVQKAGLGDLLDDDRAALLGGLLQLVDQLGGEDGRAARELWRRRGRRTFEMDAPGSAASGPAE